MVHLPAETFPLRVALVYNQKKEDAAQKSGAEDSTEPPRFGTGGHPSSRFDTPSPSPQPPTADLYAEWDTGETINAVRRALEEAHTVTLIEADEDAFGKLKDLRPDIVFNIAEGLHGVSREAQIPAMLEFLRIPYTGSDPLTLASCLDKSRAKEIMTHARIATPRFHVVSRRSEVDGLRGRFPYVVKPLHEGSSKGIANSSLVHTAVELEREVVRVLELYSEPALVEEFLPGREFTVALLGNGAGLRVLPVVELRFEALPAGVSPIYSYEAKWLWDRAESPLEIFTCPADLTPNLQTVIESLSRRAYQALRCRDWCRIDIRLDAKGEPQILELNPLPGILPNPRDNSCFPKAARAAGVSYGQLIRTVLDLAAQRSGLSAVRESALTHSSDTV